MLPPSFPPSLLSLAGCSYSKLVLKGMEKAELVIKVVMSPHEHAEEFLASYSKLMQGDTDVANFQKTLEMKVLDIL